MVIVQPTVFVAEQFTLRCSNNTNTLHIMSYYLYEKTTADESNCFLSTYLYVYIRDGPILNFSIFADPIPILEFFNRSDSGPIYRIG